MVSIRKFRIFVLVSNWIEYWSNYSIRFEISNIRTSLLVTTEPSHQLCPMQLVNIMDFLAATKYPNQPTFLPLLIIHQKIWPPWMLPNFWSRLAATKNGTTVAQRWNAVCEKSGCVRPKPPRQHGIPRHRVGNILEDCSILRVAVFMKTAYIAQ